MKNENMHSQIEFSKHGINKGVSKPPISPGGFNTPNPGEMLNMFDRNVQQMMMSQSMNQPREIVIGNVRHPAPRIQQPQGNYISTNHYSINGNNMNQIPIKSGSEYSSPRSSVGTPGDSQNSSPSSSLIQPSQPPPPYGANNRNSIASNISSLSLDSFGKGSSSPRLLSPRNSLVITDGSKYKNYVNEPAPPVPIQYLDPRLAAILQQPKVSTVQFQPALQQNGGLSASLSRGSPPPAIPARIPKNTVKSPSEKQVDLLTQQLRENMNLTSPIPTEPPPPYHGPHKTEPMPGPPPRNLTPTISSQSNGSPRVHTTAGSLPSRPSIPNPLLIQQHRTPPKPKGPTSAEKRIEELTKQVEKEMESAAQGEYFGRFSPFQVLGFVVTIVYLRADWDFFICCTCTCS